MPGVQTLLQKLFFRLQFCILFCLSAHVFCQVDTVATAKKIETVNISGRKKPVEAEKGRIIVNLQNSATTTGLTALEVLKKVPGVSIGQNNEITFRGSSGINVMVDGKPTYLSGSQLSTFLMGMSAADLNKIELLPTPSSEFDAAGNAGIINIVTRKNLKKGYFLNLRSSLSKSKFWMNNENISAEYNGKDWDANIVLDHNTPHKYSEGESGNTVNIDNPYILHRKNIEAIHIDHYTWKLGSNWKFLPKHSLGVTYSGYYDGWTSENNSTVTNADMKGNLKSFFNSQNKFHEPYHYTSGDIYYRFDIDSLGKKITAAANWTNYRNLSDGLMSTQNYDPAGTMLSEEKLRAHQPGNIRLFTIKTDAELPYKHFSVKTGLKYAEINNTSENTYESFSDGRYINREDLSNDFKYTERIAAAYFSASKKFSNTFLEAGLRTEYTETKINWSAGDVGNSFKYAKLFPSLTAEQTFSGGDKLSFSLSRRINRPEYSELNPVRWYTDKYFYFSGNPALVPELAWSSSMMYTLRGKYILASSYSISKNHIDRCLSIDPDGAIKSVSANFGRRNFFDLTASAPVKLNDRWTAQISAEASYTSYPIQMRASEKNLSLLAANLSVQQEVKLPADWLLNIEFYYFTSELRGIYVTSPTNFWNFGVRKSFFNKQLSAQLSVNDIFNTNRYTAHSRTDIIDYHYDDKPYGRTVGISLEYRFGKSTSHIETEKTEEQQRL